MIRAAPSLFAVVAALAVPALARACAQAPPIAPAGATAQLITVVAPSHASTHATLRLWRRSGACWIAVAGPWPARVGWNGLSGHHREGDGTTPTGVFPFGPVVYGIAADPGVHYAYHRLVCGDWWDEDPATAAYNTFQHVPCGARPPFAGGSEALWTTTRAYQHFAVIQYNAGPVVPGRGSAIFLHDDTGSPTNGCVSVSPARLDSILRWLRPVSAPVIAIG